MPELTELLNTLVREYGYPIFFIILLAGIIGFPVPDEGILIFAGILVARGNMFFGPALAIGLSAVWAGTLFNYWLASHVARWRQSRCAKSIGLAALRREWAVRVIYRFGFWAIPLCFFIPGLRIGSSYGAGLLNLPAPGFMAASFAGGLVWVGFYLWLGACLAQ